MKILEIIMKKVFILFSLLTLASCASSDVDVKNPPPEKLFVNGVNIYQSFYDISGVTLDQLFESETWKGKCHPYSGLINCRLGDNRLNLGYNHKAPYTDIYKLALEHVLKDHNVAAVDILFDRESGKIYGVRMWPEYYEAVYNFKEYMKSLAKNATHYKTKIQGNDIQIAFVFGNQHFCFVNQAGQALWSNYGCVIADHSEWLRL